MLVSVYSITPPRLQSCLTLEGSGEWTLAPISILWMGGCNRRCSHVSFAALRASGANGAVMVWGFQQHSFPARKSPLSYAQTQNTHILLDGCIVIDEKQLRSCFSSIFWVVWCLCTFSLEVVTDETTFPFELELFLLLLICWLTSTTSFNQDLIMWKFYYMISTDMVHDVYVMEANWEVWQLNDNVWFITIFGS